ncbi:unnamed protein product [Prorocentrum cordatum]|uniref:Uncharacterized protein n=1 Tax=Prorocentrum cordatum TaxID=2364126 RepID=A0ABN9UNR7_9DINO|nr:unnamed protein product [Polarella glacialis]
MGPPPLAANVEGRSTIADADTTDGMNAAVVDDGIARLRVLVGARRRMLLPHLHATTIKALLALLVTTVALALLIHWLAFPMTNGHDSLQPLISHRLSLTMNDPHHELRPHTAAPILFKVNTIMGTAHSNMRDTVLELMRPQAVRLDGHDHDIRRLQDKSDTMAQDQKVLRDDLDAVQRSLAQAKTAQDTAIDLARLATYDRPADPSVFRIGCSRPTAFSEIEVAIADWVKVALLASPEPLASRNTFNFQALYVNPDKSPKQISPQGVDEPTRLAWSPQVAAEHYIDLQGVSTQLKQHMDFILANGSSPVRSTVETGVVYGCLLRRQKLNKIKHLLQQRHLILVQEVHGNEMTLTTVLDQLPVHYRVFYSGFPTEHAAPRPQDPAAPALADCEPAPDEVDHRTGGAAIIAPWHAPSHARQLPAHLLPHFSHTVLAPGRMHMLEITNSDGHAIRVINHRNYGIDLIARAEADKLSDFALSDHAIVALHLQPRRPPPAELQSFPAYFFRSARFKEILQTRIGCAGLVNLDMQQRWQKIEALMHLAAGTVRWTATSAASTRSDSAQLALDAVADSNHKEMTLPLAFLSPTDMANAIREHWEPVFAAASGSDQELRVSLNKRLPPVVRVAREAAFRAERTLQEADEKIAGLGIDLDAAAAASAELSRVLPDLGDGPPTAVCGLRGGEPLFAALEALLPETRRRVFWRSMV